MSDEDLNLIKEHGFRLVGFTYSSDYGMFFYVFEPIGSQQESLNEIPNKSHTPSRFMFKNALIGLGVKPQTADDWIKVRKAKRAAQTETAFKTVASQMKLVMDEYGVTADDVVRIAVERNWQGVMARYFENIEWKDYGIKVGQTDLPFDNDGGWQ